METPILPSRRTDPARSHPRGALRRLDGLVCALAPDGLCPACDARAQAAEDAEIERREREAEWSGIYGNDDKPRPGRF